MIAMKSDRPRFKSIIHPERNEPKVPDAPANDPGAQERRETMEALSRQFDALQKQKADARRTQPAPPATRPPNVGGSSYGKNKVTLYHPSESGSTFKQWSIWIEPNGTDVTTEWGRVGATLQTNTKSFPDGFEARDFYQKTLDSKKNKGYTSTMTRR